MNNEVIGKEIKVYDTWVQEDTQEDSMNEIQLNVTHFHHTLFLRVRPESKRVEIMEQAIQRYGMTLRGRQFCLVDKHGKSHCWSDEKDSFIEFLIKIRKQVKELPRTTLRLVLFAYAKYFRYGFMSLRIPIRVTFENHTVTLPEKIAVTRKVRAIRAAAALALDFKNTEDLQLISDKKVLDENTWIVDAIDVSQKNPLRVVVREKVPETLDKKPVSLKTLDKWYLELEQLTEKIKDALSVAAKNNNSAEKDTYADADAELTTVIEKYENRAWFMYQRVQASVDHNPTTHPDRQQWDTFLIRLKPFGYASTQEFVDYMQNKIKKK